MVYLLGLLLLIEIVSCGHQGNPTSGSAKGTIVLEVLYEKAPKLAEAMYMDRMVATVSQAGVSVMQQDLERSGDRWRGELEVNTGTYTVALEAYKLSKLKWQGSVSVNVRDSKTYPVQMRLVLQNTRPVSQAGRDQQVETGSTVLLDGRGSTDLDGDRLTYRWNAPAGIRLSNRTAAQPQFATTATGVYRFSLVVNDGYVDSTPDEVVVTVNRRPVADAGRDQQVKVGAFVVLDGRGSYDPDGDGLSYRWSAPAGTDLGGATSALPHFTPTEPGEYRFTLVVNDGYVDSAPDEVMVTVNRSPVADAGPDRQVNIGAFVALDGSGSSDPDGDNLSYRWSTPSRIELGGGMSAQPHFTPTEPGEYRFTLVVKDGYVDSAPDEVVVTVGSPPEQTINQRPTADAGPDQSVEIGVRVTLDGSGSRDPEGALLTYRWAAPTGINLNVTAIRPQFVAESPGRYPFSLVVNDGTSDSDPNVVVITVNGPATGDAQIVGEIQENTGDAQVIGTIEEDTGDAEIIGDVQE